jgi:hypothetical protein
LPQQYGSPAPELANSWTAAGIAHVDTPPQSARWATEFTQLDGPPVAASQSRKPLLVGIIGYFQFTDRIVLGPQSGMIPPSLMPTSYSMNMGMNAGLGMGMHSFASQPTLFSPPAANATQDKGKGKAIDFDAAFEALSASLAASDLSSSSARVVEVDGEPVATAQATAGDGAIKPGDLDEFAKYEAEFQQWMDAQREEGEYDYGVGLQQAWESGLGADTIPGSELKYDDDGVPLMGAYQFGKSVHVRGVAQG